MAGEKFPILAQIEEASHAEHLISSNSPPLAGLFHELRSEARDPAFLALFDRESLDRLLAIFVRVTGDVQAQLDCVAAISNVLHMNEKLRQDEELPSPMLKESITKLFTMLDLVSEREINSESQYKDFLPIFRLYFVLAHSKTLLPLLKTSILKISGKLLNFVTLSGLEARSLNTIVIEILKILYVFLHLMGDTSGIDSSFVLSCNKFNLLYDKCTSTNEEYDLMLQHFGNVLLAISTDISQNYMLNKYLFAKNEVRHINYRVNESERPVHDLIANLSTLIVLIKIDSDESGVVQYVKENLHIEKLYPTKDATFEAVLTELNHRLQVPSSPHLNMSEILEESKSNQYQTSISSDFSESKPRFEDLTEEEQDQEIAKMNDLFDRIEKNGMFKLQMK